MGPATLNEELSGRRCRAESDHPAGQARRRANCRERHSLSLSAGLRIERRKLAKRAAGRRAGERGRPPRTRVRGGDTGERNLGLTPKMEFADIVAIVPILRRSSAERLLRCSAGWKPGRLPLNLLRALLPLTSHSRRAPRPLEGRHE